MNGPFQWERRAEPLEVEGAYAEGSACRQLAQRLTPERIARLRGVRTEQALILLGPAEALGWVDGILYFGRDPGESLLYLPTTQKPSVPVEWIARLLTSAPPPYLLLPNRAPISLAHVGPIAPEALLAL